MFQSLFPQLRNVDADPIHHVSAFRKLSIGTWKSAYDPSVYGIIALDARPIDAWLKHASETHAVKLTYTHFITRVVAEIFKRDPDANSYLRFQKPYRRKSISALVQVAIANDDHHKVDLSGVTLRNLESKTIVDMAVEIRNRAQHIRDGRDKEFAKAKNALMAIPFWLMFPFIQLMGFVSYSLNLKLSALGLNEDPFGTFMITNIGTFGLETGLAPLVPYSRCGLVISIGAVGMKPIVNREGQIEAAPMLHLTGTFDHRLFDGFHIAKMVNFLVKACENPREYLGDQ